MSGNGDRLIAREGIPVLGILLFLATAAFAIAGFLASFLFIVMFALGVFLFRDPRCELPSVPLAILSPASGRVLSVTEVEDYWLSRRSKRIRIRISPWDTHCLRSPTEAKVMNQWASTANNPEFRRQYAYWLQTDEADDLLMSLGMDSAAIYSRVTLTSGQRTGHGQRCGFLYFAGVIDVYVPIDARITITDGEKVSAGASILGQFVHKVPATMVTAK